MFYQLNAGADLLNYLKENLALAIVLCAIVFVLIVLIIIMIVRTVKNKKRNRRETEEAVRALANVPPDEEYLPYTPEEEQEMPEERAEESAEAQPEEPQAEPEEVQEEPAEVQEAEAAAAETEENKEETEVENKKPAEPAKKQDPAKKDTKKQAKKPEVKAPAVKKEAPKVSAANGKWVIEEVKGKFWLSLIAPNGQVMLESPTAYASLPSARSGIKTYQDNIAANRLEITEHKNGDSQVQVLNGRGGLLATSSTYSSRSQAENALGSIKRWASTTAVEEVAAKKD